MVLVSSRQRSVPGPRVPASYCVPVCTLVWCDRASATMSEKQRRIRDVVVHTRLVVHHTFLFRTQAEPSSAWSLLQSKPTQSDPARPEVEGRKEGARWNHAEESAAEPERLQLALLPVQHQHEPRQRQRCRGACGGSAAAVSPPAAPAGASSVAQRRRRRRRGGGWGGVPAGRPGSAADRCRRQQQQRLLRRRRRAQEHPDDEEQGVCAPLQGQEEGRWCLTTVYSNALLFLRASTGFSWIFSVVDAWNGY